MIIEQKKYISDGGWHSVRGSEKKIDKFDLVLVFANRHLLQDPEIFRTLKAMYGDADLLMCSTAGEIIDNEINDNSLSVTAIKFEKAHIKAFVVDASDFSNSDEIGRALGDKLDVKDLTSVLVISDGQMVNGSELVLGLSRVLPNNTILTGGLAGDGADFKMTLVGLNDTPTEGKVVAVGFYGSQLLVRHGSVGGWDPFGPSRLITRSKANVLYELDQKPALDIYKKYLGEYADELPGSALRFPLSIRLNGEAQTIVRTILSVNEDEKSLTFAGNMPEGAFAQLMKANFDRLIDGASSAAMQSIEKEKTAPELAILISCVGRRLVLGQRVDEEVDVIRNIYGNKTAIAGFYSYGEIAPSFQFMKCELHNQTMTITTLSENIDE